MADPLDTLFPRFSAALAAAFGAEHAATDPAIRRSDRADYQADVAMSLAKRLGRKPRDVAADIVAQLDVADVCDKVEIAGPGFVNLTLRSDWIAAQAGALLGDARAGIAPSPKPETVVIDYSAPNVAKEMHVGNIRSTIIGDALARVLELLGHRVVRQNHLGDWGTPFGMLIEQLVDLGGAAAILAGGAEPSVSDLATFYQGARTKFDADPSFAERARKRVVLLQSGDPGTLELWRALVDHSRRYFVRVYEQLGVTLRDEDVCGESFFNSKLAGVAAELESRGLARLDGGALCAFPAGFTGKENKPLPLIVRKSDGGYGYPATDLAAVRHRVDTLGGTRLLYVVGAPQQQHLAMVFATAREAGWLREPARAEHVAFGSVLGPDKKMFKTRAGDSVKLIDLLDEATQRAARVVAAKNPDLDDATRASVARQVGIGAVKYSDLSNDRVNDYVFDWDRMLAFEGNTAPYLMYAHARIRSIFRRGDVPVPAAGTEVVLTEPAERALALELLGLPAAVAAVADTLRPHKLCAYLFRVATLFTTFYEQCPVLKAEGAQRESRLALCELTARVLARGLDLLGIEAPHRM